MDLSGFYGSVCYAVFLLSIVRMVSNHEKDDPDV